MIYLSNDGKLFFKDIEGNTNEIINIWFTYYIWMNKIIKWK